MASLRDIRRRIASVKSTQQITRAMKMVAAAKLRRAQQAILQARPYSLKNKELLAKLQLFSREKDHPLMAINSGSREEIIVVSSDKGLCGGFNTNLYRLIMNYIKENKEKDISLTILGKKGIEFFKRRNIPITKTFTGIYENINYSSLTNMVEYFKDLYTQRERSSIVVAYNEFKSAISQHPIIEKLLPIEPAENPTGQQIIDYTYEPNKNKIIDKLLVEGVQLQVYRMLLESVSSEHASRMTAMESATNNADDMISRLTLLYNRARQAVITKELIEIVSGAEALK